MVPHDRIEAHKARLVAPQSSQDLDLGLPQRASTCFALHSLRLDWRKGDFTVLFGALAKSRSSPW